MRKDEICFGGKKDMNSRILGRVTAACSLVLLAACFTASAFGQGFARPDGSVPVPVDWSSKHVLYTAGFTPEQGVKMLNEPRVYASWLLHGNAPIDSGLRREPRLPSRQQSELKTDWSVSLGAGGVAQGMSPAKYNF